MSRRLLITLVALVAVGVAVFAVGSSRSGVEDVAGGGVAGEGSSVMVPVVPGPAPSPTSLTATSGQDGADPSTPVELADLRADPATAAATALGAVLYMDTEETGEVRAERLSEWVSPGSPLLSAAPLVAPAPGEQGAVYASTGVATVVEVGDAGAVVSVEVDWDLVAWAPELPQRSESGQGVFAVRLVPAADGTWKAVDVVAQQ